MFFVVYYYPAVLLVFNVKKSPATLENSVKGIRVRKLVHFGLHGPSCSGKGYVTGHLCERYHGHVFVIGLGDMIRARRSADPEFRAYTDQQTRDGVMIDDAIVTEMTRVRFEEGLRAGYDTFIWEGFGRNYTQMKQQMEWWGKNDGRIFNLLAGLDTVVERLRKAISEGRRSDREDNGAITVRFALHDSQMSEVARAVRNADRFLTPIDASVDLGLFARKIAFYANGVRGFREASAPTESYMNSQRTADAVAA